MSGNLDLIDLKIVESFGDNARIRLSELAEIVGLSIPSVSERVDKLQKKGIIQKFTTQVDERQLGFDIQAFVRVRVDSSKHYKSFVEHVLREDEIMECYSVTGDGSHILKVMTHNTASLERFLSRIQSWPGVLGTNTSFVLSEIKKNTRISSEIVKNNLLDRQVLVSFDAKKSRK
ncbi:Lrp/AsnC family transcriptional regulator [Prosthecochloris sp. N3]|uniref:Lrp/AsnC family transcriptional regulator n=1 Tax=Prosthecochloris ethylica TaxID=2743976 RepID=A0ABR9XQW3_9CHLB|nr:MULTISPECIES: Lrp/AsnC family transcriptional regulator [Prosthecochloris]MEC9486784.1 Lrp/AsnC family transcriptional regulator [Prosthecochloris sp.]MBF0585528.1 Lrp/AsnC family transcriptional regulator [Prosthecochloris ethylica]MBF0636314.1 Lrp/AsnC family transcriptional regulator [Prosthecochloris ethylica]NUK46758.1 Lrp/AsnC family transcriptional regulator [Prosthecochloris ethylica]RNA64661.1 Lrp/AsnC family transcriptional regulator [Prosthecochloris sp. ZM_2]